MEHTIKILHIEDNPNDAELIHEMLRIGNLNADIKWVSNKDDFITALNSEDFDLVLSDYSMPQFDGLRVLLETKKKGEKIPLIYVSGTIGEDRAVQCMQMGAMDYVLKSRLDRLAPAVKRAFRLVEEKKSREKAEQELRNSEELFRTLLNNMHDAVALLDWDGKIIYANKYSSELFGIPPTSDFTTLYFQKFIDGDYHQIFVDSLIKVKKEGSSPLMEFPAYNSSEKRIFLEISSRKISFRGNSICLSVARNITDRKFLQNENLKLWNAVESAGDIIIMTDAEGLIKYINSSFTELYGWESSEVIDKEKYTVIYPENISIPFEENQLKELVKGNRISFEAKNITKGGKELSVLTRVNPLLDENNNLSGYLILTTDISSRKEAEEKLLEAKTKAEEMNRVKSYFLSNISHELRTPLISIIGFSEILQKETQNVIHLEYLGHICDGGKRLQQTITNITELADLEIPTYEAKFSSFNLTDFVIDNVQTFELKATSKKLSFDVESSDKNLQIKIDASMLNKILSNLLSNAIKFTITGGIEIKIKSEILDETKYAVIDIIDTGIGISEDKLKIIFDAFRQQSEGLNRTHEGLGIGLTITQKLVTVLKGFLEVKSEPQKGSCFTVKFPALSTDKTITAQVDRRRQTIASENDVAPPATTLPEALLVEDNEGCRIVTKKFLDKICNLHEAEDGLTALAKTEENNYSLILMDINLGVGIDGIETMKRIKDNPAYKNVPIVALTAYAMSGEDKKFLSEGFDDYLKKPYLKEELRELVKRYVSDRSRYN